MQMRMIYYDRYPAPPQGNRNMDPYQLLTALKEKRKARDQLKASLIDLEKGTVAFEDIQAQIEAIETQQEVLLEDHLHNAITSIEKGIR